MEELEVSPRKLKEMIDNGTFIGKGNYGSVFTYQDRLIKLDNLLYSLLKDSKKEESERKVYYRYLGGRENFNDIKQIEWLSGKQKDVKLTKLPQGVLRLVDVNYQNVGLIPGIIIPYLKGYDKLEKFDKRNQKNVLIILKRLLEEVRELEENHISQEDLYHPSGIVNRNYNIMYKDDNPMIIDMSGVNINCGDKYKDSKSMYIELGQVIIDFLNYYHIESPYPRWYTDTFDKNKELVSELEGKIK